VIRIFALLAALTPSLALAQTVSSTPGSDANGNVKVVGAGVSQGAALSGVTGSLALNNTGNLAATPHICGSTVFKHITTATDTQIVAASGSQTIYVCDYSFSFNGTGNAFLEKSTSGTCASPTQIDQAWYGVANMSKAAANPYYRGLNTGASAQLCVNTSAAVSFDITVHYDQY
jgi:hypothetical protein